MTSAPSMSYVVTTRNKLPFLREVLARLVANVRPDEEIVVVDGNSTDATPEHLAALHASGAIHRFVSERDVGEAHGYNKAFLLSRGALIKVITDDDSFHFGRIQECRRFMEQNPAVDWLGTDGSAATWADPAPYVRLSYADRYQRWRDAKAPFAFCCLGLMLRRSSLPILGIFNPAFVRTDAEYTMRVTSGPANLAWYTGASWVRNTNADSNSVRMSERMTWEGRFFDALYLGATSMKPTLGEALRSTLRSTQESVKRRLAPARAKAKEERRQDQGRYPDPAEMFRRSDRWLEEDATATAGTFVVRP